MEKILDRYRKAFYLLEERRIKNHHISRKTGVFMKIHEYSDKELDYAVKHYIRTRYYTHKSFEDWVLGSPILKQYLYEIHFRLNNNLTI